MGQWQPIEDTHLVVPSTEQIRNLFAAAYPDRVDDFDRWLHEHSASIVQLGIEAAAICERESSWEHFEQTDDFPCTNCLTKARDQIESAAGGDDA